jgi:hypothetical protein
MTISRSKKRSTIFKPSNAPKCWLIKERREGRTYGGSFCNRYNYPFKLVNQRVIGRIFGHLHYLAQHAPEAVNAKWRTVYRNFMNKHFAAKGKHSITFANKYTCHRFL